MWIRNDDINVPDILYVMLTQSLIHQENDDPEVVEVDIVVYNVGVVNKHENSLKDA